MFSGASNAPGGITIDLRSLNSIELEKGEDGEVATTKVGSGLKWSEVYAVLEPLGRTVVGGRSSQIGVGGFLLGGSYPLFSP
jgi:FAD/FMN-containing dehydrogenase